MGTVTADMAAPATLASTAELGVGTKLGPYEIITHIASGGMGRVWLCARRGDFGFSRTFALKTMREDIATDPSFRRMFLAEAKLAAQVRHTNVVEMVDLGEAAGVAYQVMTWVEGASLFGLVERDAMTVRPAVPVALRIVVDMLRGLHAAHELRGEDGRNLGLVHRDVSPQNVLVGLDGVAKITDFGIAKVGAYPDGVAGKPRYMAPEQLEGAAVDRRSDVFATGVVLWELLSGERAPGFGAPPPLPNAAQLPRGLAEIVARAIAEVPYDRFPTAGAMADAIDRVAAATNMVLSSSAVAAWTSDLAGEQIRTEQATIARELTRFAQASKRPSRRFGIRGALVVAGALIVGIAVTVIATHSSAADVPASPIITPVVEAAPTPVPAPVVVATPVPAPTPVVIPTVKPQPHKPKKLHPNPYGPK